MAIQYKLLSTETAATKQERYFRKGLQRRIELITNVLKLKQAGIGNYREINIIFQRNFIIDNNEERKATLEEISYELTTRIEYRMKFHNETFEEAKKAIEELDKEKIKILSGYNNVF